MSDTSRSVLITVAVVLGVLFLFPTFLMGGMFPFGGMMGGWMGRGYASSWGWGLVWVFPLVFWGGVIATIVFLVRGAGQGGAGSPPPGGETALDILKKRYARGQITKAEFDEMRRDLG
ncbi:MAG: SHOCT domain-containing protein [Dehalococcoidia bacterium]|nr:SHOCT domain-containing protein [Dehalococcoidia bacterium]